MADNGNSAVLTQGHDLPYYDLPHIAARLGLTTAEVKAASDDGRLITEEINGIRVASGESLALFCDEQIVTRKSGGVVTHSLRKRAKR